MSNPPENLPPLPSMDKYHQKKKSELISTYQSHKRTNKNIQQYSQRSTCHVLEPQVITEYSLINKIELSPTQFPREFSVRTTKQSPAPRSSKSNGTNETSKHRIKKCQTIPVKTIAFTSFLLTASVNFSFNPARTAQGNQNLSQNQTFTIQNHTSKRVWSSLGMAKALTGGLEMVITATPSFPTSKVTLTSAIAS